MPQPTKTPLLFDRDWQIPHVSCILPILQCQNQLKFGNHRSWCWPEMYMYQARWMCDYHKIWLGAVVGLFGRGCCWEECHLMWLEMVMLMLYNLWITHLDCFLQNISMGMSKMLVRMWNSWISGVLFHAPNLSCGKPDNLKQKTGTVGGEFQVEVMKYCMAMS